MFDQFDPATDPGAFAEQLLAVPMWPHQLDLLRSRARFRVVAAGRQVGKSRSLAVLALHEAATKRNALVLLVSAGEIASRRLLEDCAALASASPLLRGSVLDESKSSLALSNGSRILSVPASQRQIRGWAVDLLIVDEAAFVDDETWRAAEPAIVARPGSRVVLASSPWGPVDHWFRVLWRRGMDAPGEMVESFHWPSSLSPLVDKALIEHWRATWPPITFQAEVLAEWADSSSNYFPEDEIRACVADYQMLDAEGVGGFVDPRSVPAVAGMDYGMRRDENVVCLLAPLADHGLNEDILGPQGCAVFVPYLAGRVRWPWDEFISHAGQLGTAYRVRMWTSEVNGIGDAPTALLRRELQRRRVEPWVAEVWTDQRRKAAMFGKLRLLMQQRQIVLPNEPQLLKQLRALTFEQGPSGGVRISVPDNVGHDDRAVALGQAVSCVDPSRLYRLAAHEPSGRRLRVERLVDSGELEVVTTPGGIRVPVPALPDPLVASGWCIMPQGQERGEPW